MARSSRGGILHRPSRTEAGPRGGLIKFAGEVIGELKKVTWPSRPETTRLTMLVIAISATIGIALGIIDMGFTRVFERFIGGLFPFGAP